MSESHVKADEHAKNRLASLQERKAGEEELQLSPEIAARFRRLDNLLHALVLGAVGRQFESAEWKKALDAANSEFAAIHQWFKPIKEAGSANETAQKAIENFHKEMEMRFVLISKFRDPLFFHH